MSVSQKNSMTESQNEQTVSSVNGQDDSGVENGNNHAHAVPVIADSRSTGPTITGVGEQWTAVKGPTAIGSAAREPGVVNKNLKEIDYKLENQGEKEIIIDQRHHRTIIGVKGEKVRELQETFNVQITFPSRVETRKNVVKIRGLNNDVNKTFKSLTKLAKALDEADYLLEIPVFKQFHKLVPRRRKAFMKKIRRETDTSIVLSREGRNSIKVTGNKEKVLIACDMIKKMQIEMGDIVTKEMILGNVKVRNVIVHLGKRFIQSIKEDCGDNVTLKLPIDKGDNTIVIKGPEDDVDNVITQIQIMVNEVHRTVIDLKVNPEVYKYLIGTKRTNVITIQNLTSTRIIVPPETNSKNKNITIFGKRENVNKAKTELEIMITDISNAIEECVEINEKYHKSILAKQEEFLHKLEEECADVKTSLPKPGADSEIALIGTKANIAIPKKRLLDHAKLLENTIQVVVNVDPKYYRHFVARRGEIINRIIDDCNGVSITFSKLATNDSVMIIKGDKTKVEAAKRKIEETVKDLEQRTAFDIIIPQGESIRNLQNKYGGPVNLPRKDEVANEKIVTVVGYQQKAESARDKIKEMVDKFINVYKEDFYIDSRIRSRLMGFRGRKISQIMAKYHVDIRFSKSSGSGNPELVTVYAREDATPDDVMDCIKDLESIQQDYLDDLANDGAEANPNPNQGHQTVANGNHNS